MSDSPFRALGLSKVINASGKMTALGGTAQTPEVAEALARAAEHHVDLAALRKLAGEKIAERTGAEAASVTTGAAAGIAIGVAAMITGTDRNLVQRLPDTTDVASEIILQAGHDVNFGARVAQMIRLGGGRPVLVGSSESVTKEDITQAIGPRTAGLLYVQSHHSRQNAGLALADILGIGHRTGSPVLVDAAAEADLRAYIEAGADLVTYSGGKAIGGPTVGFLAGRLDLIEACELQVIGIARPMKVGKEQIAGLLAALERYPCEQTWPRRLAELHEGLSGLPGAEVSLEADLAGRDIRRVALRDTPENLKALVRALREGEPSIHTRNHQIEEGLILFDLREVKDEDVALIVNRLQSLWPAD